MSQAELTRRVRIAFSTLVVLLAGIIAIERYAFTSNPSDTFADAVADDSALPTQSDQHFSPPASSVFVEVLERPLFFRDRRLPPEPKPEVVAAAPLQPLRLTLEGVAISSDSRVAVLRMTNGNQLVQLAEGMTHDGWLLESVSADRAVFKRGAQVTELLLDANGQTGRQ